MSDAPLDFSHLSRDEKQALRTRVLSDTGVLCRELLGYNYDEDASGKKVNVGQGGIVASGKTQDTIALLDNNDLHYKLVVLPREARKSTKAQGFCVKNILLWPDIRIAYVARTDPMMRSKCLAIRASLETAAVTSLFGDQKGAKWTETEFTVSTRTNVGLQNATLTGFSQESMPTGGRFNLIVVDDFIDHTNVATSVQNRKSKDLFATLQPLLARGGTLLYLATIWADDDLTNDLMGNPLFSAPYGGQIVCGAGVRVITTPEGKPDLEVLPTGLTFPHLTLDHLRQKLWLMSREGKFDHFIRQYLNETGAGDNSAFQRKFFRPLDWEARDMSGFSGYLVTDTAIAQNDEACYGVVAYVLLDAHDNIYLADLQVGHPDPFEFCNWVFEMLETWIPRVNHCGECWEDVALSNAYQHQIDADARARKIRLRPIKMKRPPASHKEGRINRLQPAMRAGNFYVLDTVPRSFVDASGPRVLWDPRGYFDARANTHFPSGELVDEFIRKGGKKDIPDAIAMVLEYENGRQGPVRACRYKPHKPKPAGVPLTLQRQVLYSREQAEPEDWWDKTLREQGL